MVFGIVAGLIGASVLGVGLTNSKTNWGLIAIVAVIIIVVAFFLYKYFTRGG